MISSILQKLPIIAVGLLLVAAALTIYIRSKNVTRSEFIKIFKTMEFFNAWILIFVIVLSGVFGVFNHMKEKH